MLNFASQNVECLLDLKLGNFIFSVSVKADYRARNVKVTQLGSNGSSVNNHELGLNNFRNLYENEILNVLCNQHPFKLTYKKAEKESK